MASHLYGDSSTDIETLRAAIASNALPKQRLYDESEFAGSEVASFIAFSSCCVEDIAKDTVHNLDVAISR